MALSTEPARLHWGTLEGCERSAPIARLGGSTSWVKLNARQHGYYRVQYSEQLWARLTAAVG